MLKSIQCLFFLLLLGTITVSLNFPSPTPPGAIGPYLNGVFPKSAPGEEGSWELEDPIPELSFPAPVRIKAWPGSSEILILCKWGEVWRVSLEDQTRELLLDIKDSVYHKGDAGAVGIALHPKFGDETAPDKQLLFMYYRTNPTLTGWNELGYNRLSKFTWDTSTETFDPDSEKILIQQYDRSSWHNGGAMFFGPDGFLYISSGGEGRNEHQAVSTQQITGGLFSGILRIDVDNDPSRSHPIRRQPTANGTPPNGWDWKTFTQDYSIPNDNPWLDPDGNILEEFYAIGLRSPHAMYFDPETELIWLADVGAGSREEINLVEKGDNLQWPYLEGTLESEVHQKPDPFIGNEKPVYYEYDRTIGSCVMGGSVYYGTQFPELNGKYLFADYRSNKVLALTNKGNQIEPEVETLISNLGGQPVEVPDAPGITGIFPLEDGQVLITIMGDYQDSGSPGKIFSLKRKTTVPEPPALLSELGAFTDLSQLTPAKGILPYTVNAPLWSDRALKKRWIAIPNDGNFDSVEEQILFHSNEEWTFPEGTVFIKHFELPQTTDSSGETIRLETRFFIIGENGIGYGLTYRWNEEGTEAFLLGGGASRDFDIYEDGAFAFTQTWDFPSRDQCMSCHNANANYVLGVKTHQMNGDQFYPHLGRNMNQLDFFNQAGMFHRDIGRKESYLRSSPIDDASVDLELRIRSYLDANCANCHRQDGVPMLNMDFRFNMPLKLQNIVNFRTQSHSSNPNHLIVKPGSHQSSELWVRDASTEDNRMPPLGRNLVDEVYIDALVEWIGNLPDDYGTFSEMLLFPNPSNGDLAVRISDDWAPPFQLVIQDNAGQFIMEKHADNKSVFLDLVGLPAGLYVLEIMDSQKRRHSEKFVLK